MEGEKVLATTPDLICLFDANTGEPVTTEAMKYGLAVNVLAFHVIQFGDLKKQLI